MQVSSLSFLSRDGGNSFWSLAIFHTCNALRAIDPFAGDLLHLPPVQSRILLCLVSRQCFALKVVMQL
jgi:hypothetical protein